VRNFEIELVSPFPKIDCNAMVIGPLQLSPPFLKTFEKVYNQSYCNLVSSLVLVCNDGF